MKYYKLLTFTLLFCLSACGGEKKDTDTTQDSVETVLPDEELIEALSQDLPEGIPYVFISSITGLGIVELKDLLWKELNKENFHEAERIVHKNIDVSTLEFEDDNEYIFPVDEDEDDPDEVYEEYWDDDEDEDVDDEDYPNVF